MRRYRLIVACCLYLAAGGCAPGANDRLTAMFSGPTLSLQQMINAVRKGRMSPAQAADVQRTSIAAYYRHLLEITNDEPFMAGDVVVSGIHTLLLNHGSSFQTLHKNFASLGSFAAKSAVDINASASTADAKPDLY